MRGALVIGLVTWAMACGEVAEVPDASTAAPIDAASAIIDAAVAAIDAASGSVDAEPGDPDARVSAGCASSGACAAGFYCDFRANHCGEVAAGTCRASGTACPGNGTLACGCNDTLYSDACAAAGSGADLAENGACTTPDGFFRCGHSYCLKRFSYCQVTAAALPGDPTDYQCVALPSDCEACSCLSGEPCGGGECENDGDGGFTLTCLPPP